MVSEHGRGQDFAVLSGAGAEFKIRGGHERVAVLPVSRGQAHPKCCLLGSVRLHR